MLQSLLRDTILQTQSRADTLKSWFVGNSVKHAVQVEPVIGERQQYEAIVITDAYRLRNVTDKAPHNPSRS